jgi:DNA-binding transcriptional regulator YiaG
MANNDITLEDTIQNIGHCSNPPEAVPIVGPVVSDQDRNGHLDARTMNLETRLEIWIVARCQEIHPQPRRVAELNAIFSSIYSDPRFWQYRNTSNYDYYEDALSKMWDYFFHNLCEVKTARKKSPLVPVIFWWKWYLKLENDQPINFKIFESWFFCLAEHHLSRKARSFLETRDYAVGRLLVNLKGHLKNIGIAQGEISHIQPPPMGETNIDPIHSWPNPEPNLALRQFEAFLYLLETDPTGELNAKTNTLHGIKASTKETTQEPYTLTGQTYLLMRHRDDMTIQQIADTLDIPRGTLQGYGKPTKWRELERKFAQMAMDSVSA